MQLDIDARSRPADPGRTLTCLIHDQCPNFDGAYPELSRLQRPGKRWLALEEEEAEEEMGEVWKIKVLVKAGF